MRGTRAVLIVGGSGFIGTHLALRLRRKYKVFATYTNAKQIPRIQGVTFLPLQLANRNWIKRMIYTAKPEVIVYAAGSNDVDWAESNTREAEGIHTGGPATVSTVADILQPKFIFLSNCYPFDGVKGNYHEGDTVLPGTALGKAKLGGENFIRSKSLNYIVVRSSPVIGRGTGVRQTFLDYLRMRLDRGLRAEVQNTEYHSFAPVSGLVNLMERLVDAGPRNKVLHYGGLTKVTHLEWAKAFATRFGYNPDLVVPKTRTTQSKQVMSDEPLFDFSLNSSNTVESLKIEPFTLESGLEELARQSAGQELPSE